jgi:hypothetical protein
VSDSRAIRGFSSLLRTGSQSSSALKMLINEQAHPGIMSEMPPSDLKQWAITGPLMDERGSERGVWELWGGEQWKDTLNVVAAEPAGWGASVTKA